MRIDTPDGRKEVMLLENFKEEKHLNKFIEIIINQPLRKFYHELENVNNRIPQQFKRLSVTKTLMWKAKMYCFRR